jgi:hypothetical protein
MKANAGQVGSKKKASYEERLKLAFATWKTARITKRKEGFHVFLEEGSFDDHGMIVNTGNEANDLKMIGFIVGTRRVERLVCDGSLDIRPIEPCGSLVPYSEEVCEEEQASDPVTQAFLDKNRFLHG